MYCSVGRPLSLHYSKAEQSETEEKIVHHHVHGKRGHGVTIYNHSCEGETGGETV